MEKFFDLHNDFFTEIKDDKKKMKYVLKNSEDESIVAAVWTSKFNKREAFEKISDAQVFTNSNKNLFLAVEDLHFLSADDISKFYMFRPLYAGLTWNTSNCLAGGALESGDLTAFGKKVLNGLELCGTFVDTAHLNEKSFMSVSKVVSKPLLCSHTACFGVCKNPRNLKDYQIKMIVDSGGLVGLCLVSDFLSGEKSCKVNDIVTHIDYFACKFGIDNLAIGTDFYGTKHLPNGIKSYVELKSKLFESLSKLGYTQKSIKKIFFENASTFFQK